MAGHGLTGELVLRESWDPITESLKTNIVDTEIAIELSAADGDSVETHPYSVIVPHTTTVSAVGMKTLCTYGAATVEVSPDDSGSTFYAIATTALTPVSICARRIRVTGVADTDKVVMQAV